MPDPKRAVAFTFDLSLVSQASSPSFQANPTLAAGDVKISIDEGAFTDLATLPTVTPAAGRNVKVALSAGEMTGDRIVIQFVDAAGAEWHECLVAISTTAVTVDDLVRSTTPANTLDVAATGEAGLDFNNILSTGVATLNGLTITNNLLVSGNSTVTGTTTHTGAVSFGSTFGVTGLTTLAGLTTGALACTTITASGAVAFQSTFIVSGATTLTGAVTANNDSNNVQVRLQNGVVHGGTTASIDFTSFTSALTSFGTCLASTAIFSTFTVTTNAIAWNAAWDAEVQSEANDALVVNNLDHLLAVAAVAGDAVDSSIIARLASKSATPSFASFVNTTDSLEAIADSVPVSDVTAIKAKTDSLTFTVAGQVDSNVQYANDVQVQGTGAAGDEWGPV